MGKHKKRKNYAIYISPYEERLYKARKLFFILVFLAAILNTLIVAALDDTLEKDTLSVLLWIVIFAVLQFLPNLKKDWVLSQVIISSAIVFLSSAFPVFKSTLVLMKYIWTAELILFCILGFMLLCNKKKR